MFYIYVYTYIYIYIYIYIHVQQHDMYNLILNDTRAFAAATAEEERRELRGRRQGRALGGLRLQCSVV